MKARGYVGERAISDALASVDVRDALSDEEKSILTNVFRQNVVLQKPEMAGAAADS